MSAQVDRITLITRQLGAIYAAGEVQRWHMNPAMAREGQTNADHQGRCVQLLFLLHPCASWALVKVMVFHDLGERWAGDLSQDFKKSQPDFAAQHAVFEGLAIERVMGGLPALTREEAQWLRFVDRLEAFCFVLLRRPEEVARRQSGWNEAEGAMNSEAKALGVYDQVRALIDALKTGVW